MHAWQFLVDRGGTFTDIVAVRPDGLMIIHKLLSENPSHYEDPVIEGIQQLLQQHKTFTKHPIDAIKMGTTVATNALLTKQGANTALLITKGFSDLLHIGTQQRPDLFALQIKKAAPLYQHVLEIDERMDASGECIKALDTTQLQSELSILKSKGVTSIAIVFLHSDKNADHEKKVLPHIKSFDYKIASHQVGAIENAVSRGNTTVLDAYLSPVLIAYINKLQKRFSKTPLYLMQSQGGLIESTHFYGRNSVLSGPAGGVVGAIHCALTSSMEKIIGFDMGGTSTDVFHYNGVLEQSFKSEIAGVSLNTPMLHIHTIAAGGGSTLYFSDARMQVGPDSAGSQPGPACYRAGGPLTITDANLFMGKLQADFFPQCFGQEQNQGPCVNTVKNKFLILTKKINQSQKKHFTVEEIASGFIDIAIAAMSQAIKSITFERGHNINDYALFCFGGASGQHACLVAERLGVATVVLHPLASVLSAYGMGVADLTQTERQSINRPLNERELTSLVTSIEDLKEKTQKTLKLYHGFSINTVYDISLQLITKDTNTPILCTYTDNIDSLLSDFAKQHQELFGFYDENKCIDIYALVVIAKKTPTIKQDMPTVFASVEGERKKESIFYSKGEYHKASCYESANLNVGDRIQGPALIIYPHTTFVLEPRWQAHIDNKYCLVATELKKSKPYYGMTTQNPILLEIFNKSFMHIATQMGYVLANTAMSVNIKERRDYSCALFDMDGGLIANAPHMPVHLGSMGDSVKAIIHKFNGKMSEGDSFILNDPYAGGTHLPDITVITPFFREKKILFYVGSRGHHADIGGPTPGSMPAFSRSIEEEGVLIKAQTLIQDNLFLTENMVSLFREKSGRNVQQNIADLNAQCAANQKGVQGLLQLIDTYGLQTVLCYTQFIQDNAAFAVSEIIETIKDGHCHYKMDIDAHINVVIKRENKGLTIDFSGTSPEHEGNFNAPIAVTKAAVLYVLRTLVNHDIPLNEGCLKQINLIIPDHSLLNPSYPHAVVSGNVETSQAVVNSLYLALGIMASAQGTMNNLTFGTDEYQYYETLCGGTGAGLAFHGTDAVHSHMTNSLLTDVELLESRYPVRIEQFAIRKRSGGRGRYTGGNGVIRQIKFLDTMQVNMIAGHRLIPVPGLHQGQPGACGVNTLIKANGQVIPLSSCFFIEVKIGDSLRILTPGGGGAGLYT